MKQSLMSHGVPLKLNHSNLIPEKEFLCPFVYIQYRKALCFKSQKVDLQVIKKKNVTT